MTAVELPSEPELRDIVARYGRLLARFGTDLGVRPLVLPNAKFFPDRFDRDQRSLEQLLHRMQSHGGLEDVPIDVSLVGSGVSSAGGGCGSGACAAPAAFESEPRLVDDGEAWHLRIPEAELGHPVVLTAGIARALGCVFLVETVEGGERIEQPADVTGDLAAVALGFGPLLLEGAYMYSKSCGGPNVAQATRLALPEIAVAAALFIAAGRHSVRSALGELGTTQRAMLSEAYDWTKSNGELIAALRDDPERVGRGEVELYEAQPWLVRVLRRRRELAASADARVRETTVLHQEPPARREARPDPKRDELRALVDEAFAEAPTGQSAQWAAPANEAKADAE